MVAAHDLEKAGVVGEPKRFGSLRDVPIVALQGRHNNVAFRLHLQVLERPGP